MIPDDESAVMSLRCDYTNVEVEDQEVARHMACTEMSLKRIAEVVGLVKW